MSSSLADFEWDDRNLTHASAHGLSPVLVRAIAAGSPKFFPNRPGFGRSGTDLMIGPDRDGRFWTVILLDLGTNRWRPITGWHSTNSEIRMYQEG